MQLWDSWITLSHSVLCFLYSPVHLISPLVENLSRGGIKIYSRLSALSVVGFVSQWMLVECMKNKYWRGDLPQIMTVHRIWEGSYGFHGNRSATDCFINSLWKGAKISQWSHHSIPLTNSKWPALVSRSVMNMYRHVLYKQKTVKAWSCLISYLN